jgi:hypothetical protein
MGRQRLKRVIEEAERRMLGLNLSHPGVTTGKGTDQPTKGGEERQDMTGKSAGGGNGNRRSRASRPLDWREPVLR